jgi:hypothetical protein
MESQSRQILNRMPERKRVSDNNTFIRISGKAGEGLSNGKQVLIAVVMYDVEEDCLHFAFPDGKDKEEGWAIMQKFLNLPESVIRDP